MTGFFQRHWALILLLAASTVLVALLFELSWPVAYVEVISIPADAVIIDGNGFQWASPARIPVPDDGIELLLTREGRINMDTLIAPSLTGEVVVLQLEYIFSVELLTEPLDISVTLDGEYIGRTPIDPIEVTPGTHFVTFLTPCGLVTEDSFTVITNEPCIRSWVLPSLYTEGLLLVGAGSRGTVRYHTGGEPDTLESYLIGTHEVTASEFRVWLSWQEPYPAADSAYRWERTDRIEELFPGDYPFPFFIAPWGQWAVLEGMEEIPVTCLSASAAEEYCEWLTEMDTTGIVWRLPTEREWETAALAGGDGPWPWGSRRPDGTLLNLSDDSEILLRRHPSIQDGFPAAAPVGSFPSNAWGLYDMAGNVWEWCASPSPDSLPPARGGSWLSSNDDCRCDSRMIPDSGLGYPYVGFRLVASLPD